LNQKSSADRRFQRVSTPQGIWVSWGVRAAKTVSRVRDLNQGGMFVSTPNPEPVGTVVAILLVASEGEIRGHGTVRNTVPREGMGIEITAMGAQEAARFRELLKRLLAKQTLAIPQDAE
jgi:hypothetical protein